MYYERLWIISSISDKYDVVFLSKTLRDCEMWWYFVENHGTVSNCV